MVAAMHAEFTGRVGVFALFDVLHVGSIHANRDIMFGFAGYGAGMASDALSIVYDEAIVHHWSHLRTPLEATRDVSM